MSLSGAASTSFTVLLDEQPDRPSPKHVAVLIHLHLFTSPTYENE